MPPDPTRHAHRDFFSRLVTLQIYVHYFETFRQQLGSESGGKPYYTSPPLGKVLLVSSYAVIETSGVRIIKILMTQQLLSRNTTLFLSRHYKTRPRSGDPSLSREYLINGISHYYNMQHPFFFVKRSVT